MNDFVLVFVGSIALGLVVIAVSPVLRGLFGCPKCKASEVATRDESNEFTGRTYRHWNCIGCGHQWSRRLWLQTNNGADADRIEWARQAKTTTDPLLEDVDVPGAPSSEETFGGGDSGGGGAGSSW